MVEKELVGVRVELPSNTPIALLRERSGERRVLPIFIGGPEATAIAFALEEVSTPRPMTHDLMKSIMDHHGRTMKKVVICELREGTFFADITMDYEGNPYKIDARPSDAIALAVRTGVSIYSDEHVLNEASVFIQTEDEDEIERFRDFLKDAKPEDFM